MPIKHPHPTTPGRRNRVEIVGQGLSSHRPLKSLVAYTKAKSGGRNSSGKITVRGIGGGSKRKLRIIDFKRNKLDITGTIVRLEYDPNRSSHLALVVYPDGDKRYILAAEGMQPGMKVVASETAEISVGNALPLRSIPVGTPIHNIELTPGKGGQMIRSAGSMAMIQSKEEGTVVLQLPSKETRLVKSNCFATIGQVSNSEHKNRKLGKAGKSRHLGIRPSVRGTAMHPGAHPHGGGEGRSGVGLKHPKTPWGKPALGKKTRNRKKYSTKYVVSDKRSR